MKQNTAVNNQVAAQNAKAANLAPQFQMMQNGGVNTAVNFAAEEFYKAAIVLRRATNNCQTKYTDLLPGLQSFVSQQFFRMNSAGMVLDALGYQAVTEVLAALHKIETAYINTTMDGWNAIINKEGEVKKIWDALFAEEQAQLKPPANMN